MRIVRIGCTFLIIAVMSSGCHDGASSSPTSPVPPEASWAGATVKREFRLERDSRGELLGPWRGSSAISAALRAPTCSTGGWPVDRAQELRAEILQLEDGSLDLHLVLPDESEEICHLELIVDGPNLRAAPWYDLDDIFDPGSCHYPLSASGWSCDPAVTEIWIRALDFEGTLENRSRRIRGTLSARYDYR